MSQQLFISFHEVFIFSPLMGLGQGGGHQIVSSGGEELCEWSIFSIQGRLGETISSSSSSSSSSSFFKRAKHGGGEETYWPALHWPELG